PTFAEVKRVHIVGVCGTLMGAFAAFLKRRGIEVTGSDENVYPPMSDVLKQAGVSIFSGYRAENLTGLPQRPDLVVIGNVITRANLEAQAAMTGGYAYCSLPEFMERLLLPTTRNLVVAGTHGKTTTSSLLAHVLNHAGQNPAYFIGGVSPDIPQSFHVPRLDSGTPFVLEGDEYDTAFWDKVPKFNHYLPNDVILTSVEFDHADIYRDLAHVMEAFRGLLARIRAGGRLIVCTDYATNQELLQQAQVPVVTYGARAPARFRPEQVVVEGGRTSFAIMDYGDHGERDTGPAKRVADISLQLPGEHNVLNALAVWIQATTLGLASDIVAKGLASFRGVKRRQEERGEVKGVLVVDDFAHHPTAVKVTLQALRAKYPQRRLVSVFEPRSATSRRKIFQRDYVDAFLGSDSVFIAAPFNQEKIASDDRFSSEELVRDIAARGVSARIFSTVEAGVEDVAHDARPGDLVAVLSNGGFGGFIPKLLAALQAR
ncbi:MAG: UDP-N-acetylmuramate--L-alanine ligase, partial [Bacteriovoracia bacterium]